MWYCQSVKHLITQRSRSYLSCIKVSLWLVNVLHMEAAGNIIAVAAVGLSSTLKSAAVAPGSVMCSSSQDHACALNQILKLLRLMLWLLSSVLDNEKVT